jgi:cytochrome c biogenesis protein CcdA
MQLTLPVVISGGFFNSLNPCAISLLLLYIAMMYSMQKSRESILTFGFFYISSLYITYFLIGLGLLKASTIIFPGFFIKGGAVLAIFFGLMNLKEYFFPNLPFHIKIPLKTRQKVSEVAFKATIPAAIVLGALIAVSTLPCSGAVYLATLSYIRARETFTSGVLYLLLYNLMFVLPLIVIYAVASNRIVVEKMINWQEKNGKNMHLILGFVMIILGAGILYLAH